MKTIATATAALALGIEAKALDNLLNSGANELLPTGERGRSRRIPLKVLELITLVLLLKRDLGVPEQDEIQLGSLAVLRFDVARLRDVLRRAIADALETVVPPRRGRPPARTRPS